MRLRDLIPEFRRFFPAPQSMQSRLFRLLAATGLGAVIAVNLIWLPSVLKELEEGREELQTVAVEAARDQIRHFTDGAEQSLKRAARLFQVSLPEGDQQALREIAERLLHQAQAFEEVGIVDAEGKHILRLSRRLAVIEDEPTSSVLASYPVGARLDEPQWGPVIISDTSEPWAPLAIHVSFSHRGARDGVYALVNLRRLLHLAEDFRLGEEARLYVVGRNGKLIAASDRSVVLKQLSLAARPLVRELLFSRSVYAPRFVHDHYSNELGIPVLATGVRLDPAGWGIIVEQPEWLLYGMVREKIWFFLALSAAGLVGALLLAHFTSRRFAAPITRLTRGVERIAAGQLNQRVLSESGDEIGELAMQFNRMAGALDASYRGLENKIAERTRELSSLYTAMAPLAGQTSLQELFERIVEVLIAATGSDAAAIHSRNPESNSFLCVAQQGFPDDHKRGSIRSGSPVDQVFTSGEPMISPDVRTNPWTERSEPAGLEYPSCAFLPFAVNGRTRGVIHLASKRLGFFKDDKNEYLMTIARLMGIVVENNELMQSSIKFAEELRQSNRELEQSNRELEQFAYVASHDLQEPLRMVSGYTQLLSQRYRDKLGGDAAEFIAFAVDGAKRMHGLINDLLAYSRFGSRDTEFTPTDSAAALQKALGNLQSAVTEAQAAVTHAPLPVLTADRQQLTQLFQNLIGNAIKYRGSRPPVIHVDCERKPDAWLFSVKDNGIGIDPQFAERIFVIFQRLHTREQYPGTGIGLAICKKIVERHGGKIWVESVLEKGATFYFTIPVHEGSGSQAASSPSAGRPGPARDEERGSGGRAAPVSVASGGRQNADGEGKGPRLD